MLSFLDISVESLQIVSDNARLPARSQTMSAPPVRRRRDRDAWKRRSSSTSDLEQLHNYSRNSSSRTSPRPNYNRWDTSCCPQLKATVSTPSLMLLQIPRRQSSIRGFDSCSPPKKPIRRMNSIETSKETARLLEHALLITNDCSSCEF